MQADDLYQSWKKTKRGSAAPDGFADKVMESIRKQGTCAQSYALRHRLAALAMSRPGRVAVCLLASVAYLFRLRQVVSIFLE